MDLTLFAIPGRSFKLTYLVRRCFMIIKISPILSKNCPLSMSQLVGLNCARILLKDLRIFSFSLIKIGFAVIQENARMCQSVRYSSRVDGCK
jgi:hypothetical protein